MPYLQFHLPPRRLGPRMQSPCETSYMANERRHLSCPFGQVPALGSPLAIPCKPLLYGYLREASSPFCTSKVQALFLGREQLGTDSAARLFAPKLFQASSCAFQAKSLGCQVGSRDADRTLDPNEARRQGWKMAESNAATGIIVIAKSFCITKLMCGLSNCLWTSHRTGLLETSCNLTFVFQTKAGKKLSRYHLAKVVARAVLGGPSWLEYERELKRLFRGKLRGRCESLKLMREGRRVDGTP